MEEADLYFIDTRNADPRDHRTQGGSSARPPGARPVTVVTAPGSGQSRVIAPAHPAYGYPYPTPYGTPYGAPYGNPYMMPPSPIASTLLGRVSTGQLIDLIAKIFAAVMPLPGAPNPTSDTATDLANLITYQGSLANYAKRDEQVRTIGSLVTQLVG